MNGTNENWPRIAPEDNGGDREMESVLDHLGQAERESAPRTLEARVLASTQALLAKPGTVTIRTRPAAYSWGLRMAAAVALIASVGAVWLAIRPAAPTQPTTAVAATLAEDIDAIVSGVPFADANVADELVKLDADTLNFGQTSISQDWLDTLGDSAM